MIEVDYIVVGLGIAGLSFCEQLERHQLSFMVIDSGINPATKVSGGVLNPVVLKRFTMAWKANEILEGSLLFYKELSNKLAFPFLEELPVYRILNNVEEQNDWVVASDKKELSRFMASEITKNTNANVIAPFGFGRVYSTGRINPSELLKAYRNQLQKSDKIRSEAFDYNSFSAVSEEILKENSEFTITYKDIKARKIVFAQGAEILQNPLLPKIQTAKGKNVLIPNKGEYITIKSPELKLSALLKGPVYIIPLGNELYKVGATYDRDNTSSTTTENARDVIVTKLKKMINCDFEIVAQEAGIRPTTIDRRPLLGLHPENANIAVFNGLGTHGILGAPYLSNALLNLLENNVPLADEMDLGRWM